MKYAHIDGQNKLLGWYDTDIHTTIPTPNIEVTKEQWQIAINEGHNKVNANGTTEIFDFRTEAEVILGMITHFKALYLGVVDAKLKELDYDSLATVKLWEDDANFGAEATRILTWYKAIIVKNYELLNAGTLLTNEEYLAQIGTVVF